MSGEDMEHHVDSERPAPPMEAQYVDGWFTKEFAEDRKPTYGYPPNHLPETTPKVVKMVTGFIASFQDGDGK